MLLSSYIESIQSDLRAAAALGGSEVSETAELLATALESAARLSLLEALADASAEITTTLESTSVEARLRGREVDFIVEEADHALAAPKPTETSPTDQSGDVARISLRLPESLKEALEKAAGAENISVNSWLVGAISAAVDDGTGSSRSRARTGRARFGKRLTGYARA